MSATQAAVAAIQFALQDDDPVEFLHCWNEGDFDAIRREWPNAPEEVFIGADPLHPETAHLLALDEAAETAAAINQQMTAAAASAEAVRWQWVPAEPTPEMVQAGWEEHEGSIEGVYLAMLTAAPKPRPWNLTEEARAAISAAAERRETVAELAGGGVVFLNYGDEPDYAHLDCPACGGSGHVGDTREGAVRDVLAERRRQIDAEGWTPEHDDEHNGEEIAAMAALYLMPEGARDWDASSTGYGDTLREAMVPHGWYMPNFKGRRDQLVKGVALGLAEIERTDRADAKPKWKVCPSCTTPDYCTNSLRGCDITESQEAGIEPIAAVPKPEGE